ncbi:MAG: 1-(5-phosphoribosyl)-5-[(5-phosphoribosylamino)methylideneamino]imidazole-4-carboxamide isomerase [Dehalococcoidia bacterium]|nr:1-(5-phosphoribosyl)-5-[(5-phosphoribosylamino)methylideneamino]imidazole-4-carboxamide isomerase [Dehalococcoidia bacterium]MDW8120065.1 1-(5-phosphoribosyl)-5-[(5-phosphoribosylamino)methylideneamino]imidazole-4-carboxamide isomerase [Chloroflexota bacterium]
MEVIPAIDLRWGRVVRLYQGAYEKEEVFSEDPPALALHWQELGAPRLHLVDLDGALQGRMVNLGVINGIVALVDIPVQVGGGIRTLRMAQELREMGVQRVVLGTVAVEQPRVVERMVRRLGAEAVVVALDARNGRIAIKGWTEETPLTAGELLQRMADLGVRRFLYTDILRDGTMTEPNFEAIAHLVEQSPYPIIVSGGISTVEHLVRLARLGVEGAIVGRALYTGAISLPQALEAVRQASSPAQKERDGKGR